MVIFCALFCPYTGQNKRDNQIMNNMTPFLAKSFTGSYLSVFSPIPVAVQNVVLVQVLISIALYLLQ